MCPAIEATLGRFRKHNATSNRDVIRHHWPRWAEPNMLPEVILERKIALKALRRKALRLVRQKTTILGREDQAPATSRLSGSRAQAIPRHVTSRFGVALCFLNLPIVARRADTRNVNFLKIFRNIFCVQDTKFVSDTNVARVAKSRGHIWETWSRQQRCATMLCPRFASP